MFKAFLSELGRNAHTWTKENQTKILSGLSIGCTIGAVGTAVIGTIKAIRAVDAKKEELHIKKNERLPAKDVARTCWKYYAPVIAFTVGSISFNLSAESKHSREYAALASVCTLSETAFREYKDQVIETLGEKEETRVREAIAKDHLEKDPVTAKEIIVTGKGKPLCYDSLSGRYFDCDIEVINNAIIDLNYRMMDEMYVSLNDFYDEIGLPEIELGHHIGWSVDNGKIVISKDYGPAKNGEPCLVIGFSNPPVYKRGY